jgi:hypothetical protein
MTSPTHTCTRTCTHYAALKLLTLAALLASATAAQATISIYTTQASYLAAVSAPGTDSFNTLDPNALSFFLASPATRNAGAYSYRAVSTGSFYVLPHTATDVWLSALTAGAAISLNTFSAGVRGVGGYLFTVDGGDAVLPTRSLSIAATDGSGTNITVFTNTSDSKFIGFVSDGPLTSVVINVVGATANTYVTMNDITLGAAAAVPEPASVLLMLGGVAGLLARSRRQRG